MDGFGSMTERIKTYRENMLSAKPRVCAERALLATQSYQEHRHQLA